MSYSRWGNSKWYTYWQVDDFESDVKSEQLFSICTVAIFTYKQLKEDIEGCIQHVRDEIAYNDDYKETDFKELRGYMNQFIKDMDREFPKSTKEKIEDGEMTLEDGFIEEV